MAETESNPTHSRPDTQFDHVMEADDEIYLKDLVLNLWHYRTRIVVLSICVTFIIAAIAAWIYFGQSKHKMISLEFKLEFEGVDENEYPNGLSFSTADILSTPILSQVFKENDLEQFIDFHEFKTSLTIYQTNDELKLLEFEYAERLRQENLSLEERDRLETEFLDRKKTAMAPFYTLSFGFSERLSSFPQPLVAKVLNDILRVWANHADRVKGVNKYRHSLVSRNILSEKDLEKGDYFIASDMLRTAIKRIREDIDLLQKIPGAEAFKIGENGISLKDLQFRIEDVQQFKLNPLLGHIRESGASKNPVESLSYLRNRLFELNLREQKASANVAIYENSFNQYNQRPRSGLPNLGGDVVSTPSLNQGIPGNVPAMIPQFGASFLDSLIEMARENSDMNFRQQILEKVIQTGLDKVDIMFDLRYYKDLYDRITSTDDNKHQLDANDKEFAERIYLMHQEIYSTLMRTIDEVNAIYMDLSKYNLNPESILFKVTRPVSSYSTKPIRLKRMLFYVIVASLFAVFAIVIGVSVAVSFTNSRSDSLNKIQ